MYLLNKTIYFAANQLRKFGYDFKENSDERIIAMRDRIKQLGGQIKFKIEQYSDGSWTAESINIDGIITGGVNAKTATSTIKDAIFTYFGIPPHLCNNTSLRTNNKPVILKQHIYV